MSVYQFNAMLKIAIVATVLTACGIETPLALTPWLSGGRLQQYLPLAVLKLFCKTFYHRIEAIGEVATVLTACGIETGW